MNRPQHVEDASITDPARWGLPPEAAGCGVLATWYGEPLHSVTIVVSPGIVGMIAAAQDSDAGLVLGERGVHWIAVGWPVEWLPADVPPEWKPVYPLAYTGPRFHTLEDPAAWGLPASVAGMVVVACFAAGLGGRVSLVTDQDTAHLFALAAGDGEDTAPLNLRAVSWIRPGWPEDWAQLAGVWLRIDDDGNAHRVAGA